ncbi:rubredoxin [Flavitalea sp. BT771]|uniref:rubredoxin n=1 Tax=Flavitalea sp. BT771 TaxID=3063329 RepID=UPI0026E45B08|nr:rubredoxin [Flavitalea sp. BT771]MDO6431236.1 rubredoxin [Flavitalea sp. BT771]MDV6220143.1 rubredoxin [Flavitalea sp. BT771]
MFRKNYIVKINLSGGIVAAGELYAIVSAAERARVVNMQLGTRQQLFCKVTDKYGPAFLQELQQAGVAFEANEERYPNIVSSYVTGGIFTTQSWVSEGLYRDILGAFDYKPRLKVNLVERNQSFVPFFTGNINFISSDIGNYWYLYVRWPQATHIQPWKDLICSQDIPRISRFIEEAILHGSVPSIDGLYAAMQHKGPFATQPVRSALQSPSFDLPYYEGFSQWGNKTWLGIYRREELFPVPFLKDICLVCLETRVGQLYTTPWKSLIIKGIEEKDKNLWEYVMGKYRINLRHASNELNWQVEDLNEEGLRLKRYLVRQFDLEDVRTEGLCFAIKTRPRSGLSGSVIIRKQEVGRSDQRKVLDRYDILHTPDFNANSKEYILYREGLEKENLFVYLVSLCKSFYEQQSRKEPAPLHNSLSGAGGTTSSPAVGGSPVFQCRHCLTVYDEQYGDPAAGEPAGRPFAQVAPDYACPVCGSGKSDFRLIEKTAFIKG